MLPFTLSLIPASRRSAGEGNRNPLQYSCLENPTDGGAWLGYSPWDCRESDVTEYTHTHAFVTTPILGGCSVTQSRLTLCDPMGCSTPDFSVHHQLPGLTQTHVH